MGGEKLVKFPTTTVFDNNFCYISIPLCSFAKNIENIPLKREIFSNLLSLKWANVYFFFSREGERETKKEKESEMVIIESERIRLISDS